MIIDLGDSRMSDKVKWIGIYLVICFIPLLFYFLQPLNPEIVSHPAITNFLIFAPYIGLTLVALLGWKINQTRIFWSTLLFLAFYHCLLHQNLLASTETGRFHALQLLSVAFPLALGVIYTVKESRLWSDLSLARMLVALFPFLFFICLINLAPDIYQKLLFWNSSPLPDQNYLLPNLCWIAAGFFVLVIFFLPGSKVNSFLIATGIVLLPFFFCVQGNLNPTVVSTPDFKTFLIILSFSAITAILLHSILRMYWQKVYVDPLTAIPNRQALDERLHTLSNSFALGMVDIDHFKKFNDTYGHLEGDNVLRMVAQLLKETLGDRVYRYGGEEFCVIFEGLESGDAMESLEKMRSTMEDRKFYLRGPRKSGYQGIQAFTHSKKHGHRGKNVKITVSVGLAFSGKYSAAL